MWSVNYEYQVFFFSVGGGGACQEENLYTLYKWRFSRHSVRNVLIKHFISIEQEEKKEEGEDGSEI